MYIGENMDMRSRICLESAAARAVTSGAVQTVLLDSDDCNLHEIGQFTVGQPMIRAHVQQLQHFGQRQWQVIVEPLE